jgi:DNA-binding CsgD family transcriptional regulator
MPTSSGRLAPHARLNDEEAQIAALLAAGHTTDAIANVLGMSTARIHSRLDALSRKLNKEVANP